MTKKKTKKKSASKKKLNYSLKIVFYIFLFFPINSNAL